MINKDYKGTLYIVATPIGNLKDISLRALEILKKVDIILAENTKHSLHLLNHFGIQKPLVSFHEHNEKKKCVDILEQLNQGKNFALISDAGTPLISDPGFQLVRFLKEKDIKITPIPGACALITALSASGIPCDTFTFVGFLPVKQIARLTKLKELVKIYHTIVIYEAPHRIKKCVQDIAEVYGENQEICLVKELTKSFETFLVKNILEITRWFLKDKAHQKGEFIIIIPPISKVNSENSEERILNILLKELPFSQAVKIASKLTAKNKRELYQQALKMKNNFI